MVVSPLLITVLVTASIAAGVAAWVALRRRHVRGEPWWGNPAVWIGASLVFALVGVVVAPRLLGSTFVFLPFLWMGRARRRTPDRTDGTDGTDGDR